ncbi:MAG: hypothetical protein ABI616_05655 [Pseudomonadota bacterium]
MENLSLEVAYGRYGAQITNKQRSLSAIAADGSLVLTCLSEKFSRPGAGILRYSGQLSQEGTSTRVAELAGHLKTARDADASVRAVVITPPRGIVRRVIHVRTDLVGKVVDFDGDAFVVDFTRPAPPLVEPRARRKR